MTIKIYTTGGTIDKIYFDQKSEYHVGDPQVQGVLERANVVVDFEVAELFRKDSLDIEEADRQVIRKAVEKDPSSQVIITHGTDTMVTTAKALLGIPGKTIVLTGSMFPAQYRDSDSVFNLGCALIGVQTLPPGVYIAINGRIFDPEKAVKNVECNRFEVIDA